MGITIGLVTFFTLLILAFIFDARRRTAAWTLAAKRLGLSFPDDDISGVVDGVQLTIQHEGRGVGNSRKYFTVVTLNMAGELPSGMSIRPEKILETVAALIGSEVVQFEFPGVDSKLMVNALDESQLRVWAQRPNVSASLQRLVSLESYWFEVTSHQIRFERRGSMANAEKLEALIRELVAITKELSADTDQE